MTIPALLALSAPPSYRSLLKPAFLTAGASLLAFGLAHAAFITWVPTPSQLAGEAQPPLALRLLVMLAAPMGFGIPFAVAAALTGAAAWRATGGTRIRPWTYGAAVASALAVPIGVSLIHGPYGDGFPAGPLLIAVLGSIVVLPAALGSILARSPAGLVLGIAAVPLAPPWTGFIMGAGVRGWVAPFVASLVLILVGSGRLMGRLAPRPEPFSPEAFSSPS